MSSLPIGTVLGGTWKISGVVGEGAMGKVYGVNCVNGTTPDYSVVAKVIPLAKGTSKHAKEQNKLADTLHHEYTLHNALLIGFPFAPRIPEPKSKAYRINDETLGVRFLVMERLDRDLTAFAKSSSLPSVASIASIGLQLLEGLKWLHAKGYLFVDVKPDNFMLKGDKIYFVDYGLMEKWTGYNNGKGGSRNAETKDAQAGSPTYMSLDTARGQTPARKDDIEAMGYVLLSLANGCALPWSTASTEAEGNQMKAQCNIVDLANRYNCTELGDLIASTRNIAFEDEPDYETYAKLLKRMSARSGRAGITTAATSSSSSSSTVSAAATSKKSSSSKHPAISAATVLAITVTTPAVAVAVSTRERKTKVAEATLVHPSKQLKDVTNTNQSNINTAVDLSSQPKSLKRMDTPISKPINPAAVLGAASATIAARTAGQGPSLKRPLLLSPATATTTTKNGNNPSSPGAAIALIDLTAAEKVGNVTLPPSKRPSRSTTVIANVSAGAGTTGTANAGTTGSAAAMLRICHAEGGEYNVSIADLYRQMNAIKVIGREGPADICILHDDMISEQHLKIKVDAFNCLQLLDNGSTNGTKINGARITRKRWTAVSRGDAIKIGDFTTIMAL